MDFASVFLKVQSIGLIVLAVLVGMPALFRAIEALLHSVRLFLLAVPGDQKEGLVEGLENKLESLAVSAQKVSDVVSKFYGFLFPQPKPAIELPKS